MEALVHCRCTHSIAAHEDGGCSAPRCGCRESRYKVIDAEINRLKIEHAGYGVTPTPTNAA